MNPFAHLGLGDIPLPPPRPDTLPPVGVGSVPRGFYEINEPQECHDSAPAFIRGLLMPRADYDAMTMQQRLSLVFPPRWALYGGPIPTRKAAQTDWETSMHFWAAGQGLIWVSFPDSPACVVANHRIPWPANSSFQWTWVREIYQPQRVRRDPTSITPKYVWEGS